MRLPYSEASVKLHRLPVSFINKFAFNFLHTTMSSFRYHLVFIQRYSPMWARFHKTSPLVARPCGRTVQFVARALQIYLNRIQPSQLRSASFPLSRHDFPCIRATCPVHSKTLRVAGGSSQTVSESKRLKRLHHWSFSCTAHKNLLTIFVSNALMSFSTVLGIA